MLSLNMGGDIASTNFFLTMKAVNAFFLFFANLFFVLFFKIILSNDKGVDCLC